MTINAFTGLPANPSTAPTVDDDVARLISRHGYEAVKEALKRQKRTKTGRKPERDWPELRAVLEQDAQLWLAGGDPLVTRSNYSIAKDFADHKPGHSHPGTMRRIERKLAKQRTWMMLVIAERISRDAGPFASHIRALKALWNLDRHSVWQKMLVDAEACIVDFERKTGKPPAFDLTFRDIEDAVRPLSVEFSQWNVPKNWAVLRSISSKSTD